jgi:HK97 family phage prohead protease
MAKSEVSASIALEFKDLDSKTGTGIIKHSVYNSIDLADDISTKGMFAKSWIEAKAGKLRQKIGLLFNHVTKDKIGYVTDVYDDNDGAYTEFKLLDSQRTRITELADADLLTGASFGYETVKKENVQVKTKRVRKLLEVKHYETSILDVQPCHPEAGLIILNKAFEGLEIKQLSQPEQDTLKSLLINDMANLSNLITLAASLDTTSDLYGWIMYNVSRRADTASSIMDQLRWNAQQINSMKAYVDKAESYCTKATASDDSIITLQNSLTEYKQIISDYDTAITHLANEPAASDDEIKAISNFINKLKTA